MGNGAIRVTLDSYYEMLILGEAALCMAGWVWCMVINSRQGVGRFNLGNVLHVAGFTLVIHRNLTHYFGVPRMVQEQFMQETVAVSTCWLAGVTWFIVTYYWNRWKRDEWGKRRELGAFNAEIADTEKNTQSIN